MFATGGHAMIRDIAAGDDHWIPLESTKSTQHPNRPAAGVHALPHPRRQRLQPCMVGANCEIRMNPTSTSGVNRGEHLRALPAYDERYPDIYNRRQMAESLNSWIKAQVPGRRAHLRAGQPAHRPVVYRSLP